MADSEITRKSMTAAFAASVGMFVGTTPMVGAVSSLFMQPVSAEFGVNRTSYSSLLLLQAWIVALCAPWGGRLLDRYGTRRILLPVVLVFGLVQWAMSLASAFWQFAIFFGLTGVCGCVHTYTAYTRVISTWFAKRRGVVMGLMLALGSSLGAVLIPQLVRRLNEAYGWRAGYVGMGSVILFYGFPIMLFFLREPAGARPSIDAKNLASTVNLPGDTWGEALRSRPFWTICTALVFAPMAIAGTVAHSVPMLIERGSSFAVATNAVSAIFGGAMLGQLGSGYLLDRFDTPRIALPFFAAAMIGAAVTHTTGSPTALIMGALLLGLGHGSELGIGAYLVSRYYGLRSYGAIYGCVFSAANLGVGIGILSMARVHDITGSYSRMAYVMPAALLVTMLLLLTLGPYKYPKMSAVSAGDRGSSRAVK